MENSKKFLAENNIGATISFKDGQAHTVELLKDKIQRLPLTKDQDHAEWVSEAEQGLGDFLLV